MKMKALIILAVILVFVLIISTEDEENICETCEHRFCVSSQHPTICDECKDGSNYWNWLEGGR